MGVDSENPGVYTGYITPGAQLSVGGAPPGRSVILVDGSDVTQASFPRAGISVSGDMVQETTVVVGGVPAQYGRTMGGAIVQATRSGNNEFHGGGNWRHTDPAFNAYPARRQRQVAESPELFRRLHRRSGCDPQTLQRPESHVLLLRYRTGPAFQHRNPTGARTSGL